MLTRITNRKLIAVFCLTVFSISTFTPTVSYALTSGPAQPEMQGFTPAGTNDMVDAFTGDFSYNIPLMDVGGYPLNISYRSGASIDDEASWVGYGWSLTPGVVNRQMRGLPDDFKGDRIKKSSYAKPNRTFGLTADAKVKLKGFKIGDKPKASLNTRIGIRYNNYTGIGASMGASASLSLTDNAADPRTVDMGIKTDNQSGATLDFSSNFLTMIEGKDKAQRSSSLGSPVGFSFSANAGVENLTLSASYGKRKKPEEERNYVNVRSISFLGNAYTPQVRPFNSSFSGSFKVSLGAKIFPFFIAAGFTGSYSTSEIPKDKITTATRSYGFLYNTDAKSRPDALMDFNRENDIPFNKKIPNLPVPIYTPDLFNVSSQGGGGQYRLYAGGSGVLADNFQADNSFSISTGIELGFGTGSHVGANLPPSFNNTINTSGKWVDKNNFLPNGDFKNKTLTEPALQPVYFKKVGEGTISDNGFYNTIGQQQAVRVGLDNSFNAKIFGSGKSSHAILNNRNVPVSTAALTKTVNEKRNSVFSYLTAVEAGKYGLNASILSYTPNSLSQCFTANGVSYPRYVEMPETNELYPSVPKKHHISEITITEPGGGRQVFGVPVYNVKQEEVSFSVVKNTTAQNNGYINYPAGHSVVSTTDGIVKSTEYHYHYHSQVIPAYTTAYLLSGILSPDYVDLTNNGITHDDLGTAVRFNYSKMPYLYKWRTPHAPKSANQVNVANYNEGLLSDKKDDKATFSYGEKELWYSHSIESKTMVALFILNNPYDEARKDGLGVLNRDGGIDYSNRLRYLKEIRLFSKAEIIRVGPDAQPIKTVHFEYSYELFKGNEGLPNSEGVNGKLTLKKIWFTFGNNGKGVLSPYEFSYNLPDGNDIQHNNYLLKQYDRWGNYKPNSANPGNLRNAEYPYSAQDTALANKYTRYWNLSTIVMPTGGILRVNYESDDYAYVQDKRAAAMMPITGIGTNGNAVNIINQNKIFVTLPNPANLNPAQLKTMYFEGIENLYFKCYVDVDNRGNYEYVPGYGKIQQININGNIAEIEIEKIKNNNPISTASWQLLKTSLPRLAYPGYDNMDNVEDDFKKIVAALAGALGRLPELVKTFDAIAKSRNYSSKIDLSRSWVRINSPMYKKMGGGNRVSSLTIADDWKAMTANANAPAGEYGQRYLYTTEKQIGGSNTPLIISSGVASYEPILGADENPFRQPVMYSTKNFLGPSTTNYIERPLGETFFQAPSVGYSKIRVINIGATPNSDGKTGSVETEFYTAKDFPVQVSETPIETIRPALGFLFRFFAIGITEHLTTSQGYAVINNNMHGKIKSEKVFAKNGQEIASTHYEYNLKNPNAASPELKNTVDVLTADGTVQPALMGVDADIFHDMRQVSTDNMGAAGEPSLGLGIPLTGSNYFNWGWYLPNYERRMFRSTVSIKTIYQFGILKKVTKKINGSTIETENLLWDAETGDVLLTKTQNEFDNPIYSFIYPAHWAYKGMGSAYKNQGLYLYNFSTTNSSPNFYTSLLAEGDELVNVGSSQEERYWVIDNILSPGMYKIINSQGHNVDISNATIKVLRSGYRNMSASPIGTIVCLNNPIQGNQLNISVDNKILDAKSVEYKDDWLIPFPINCNAALAQQDNSTHFFDSNKEISSGPHANEEQMESAALTGNYFNPYLVGAKGNWRQFKNYVYDVSRVQPITSTNADNIRNNGHYSMFAPFWKQPIANNWQISTDANADKWRWTSHPTIFDMFGHELESKDALGRYNAAIYGFEQALPTAVASNARASEITFDGFEDYRPHSGLLSCDLTCTNCNHLLSLLNTNRSLSCYAVQPGTFVIDEQKAHSGKHSLKTSIPLVINKELAGSIVGNSHLRDVFSRYLLEYDFVRAGFLPYKNKQYVLSFWIKDNQPNLLSTTFQVKVNDVELIQSTANKWPIVEGWKKVELIFNIPNNQTSFKLELKPVDGAVNIDDFRVYPFDGQLKSFVYHPITFRLMAELDENNFATFYEYDDEGTLIRVKKETEKGIATIKETRSSNRKKQ